MSGRSFALVIALLVGAAGSLVWAVQPLPPQQDQQPPIPEPASLGCQLL